MAVVEICGLHFFFQNKTCFVFIASLLLFKTFLGRLFCFSNVEIDRVTDFNDAKETTTQIFLDKN